MSVLFILIGFSLLLSLSFLIAFLWASKKGQFDDTYTPSVRILFDDIKDEKKENNNDRMENF
ncbi:MAG TPA: cbb3-type cytochrome oxidase assembly protein CcoS [candidate division Zixibacteria bacterium]|nr:cbb3-type cytochrome oxidase assembly protein CcoS [candidate division Zixibacteria bacterium]